MQACSIALVVGLIVIFVLVMVALSNVDFIAGLQEADADDIKAAADAQLAAELQESDADKDWLAKITKIDDDEERLLALADYADRGRV